MRKLCLPLTVIAATAAFAIGCEDGPNQTFQPAPSGAGSYWNNGNSDAAVAQGAVSFEAGFPTVNKVTLCSTDFKRQRWAWMLTQPIQPPRRYAGIDMAKDDLWDGLTIEEAETPPSNGDPTNPEGGLCQSTPFGFQGTCPSGIGGCNGGAWGNAGEVGFSWNVATHILDQMTLNLGYTGKLQTNKYPDNNGEMHAYTLTIGDIYRRDGEPFEINWNSSTDRATKITNIFNAIMATYSGPAGVPFSTASCTKDSDCAAPGTKSVCECLHQTGTGATATSCVTGQPGQCGVANCATDGNCLVNPNNGGGTYFGIRPMVVYIVGQAGVPQPALSTPTLIYNFLTKFEPYSNLPQTVTLDATGPTAVGTPIGSADGGTCIQHVGQTFDDLTKNCVAVTGNSTVDTVNVNKIEHGLTHDQEHWTANVLGINQNFTSATVAANPNIVVLDTDTPQPGDVTQDYEFDLRARGALSNDGELQGSALMMIEWARELLEDVANQQAVLFGVPSLRPRQLGDPACVGFTGGVPNYVTTNAAGVAGGKALCSGIEGLIIPNAGADDFSGDPVPNADPNANLNPVNNYDQVGFYASVLHPGDIYGALCIDGNASTDCTFANVAATSLWTNMLNQVIRVEGNGDVNAIPAEMRDRRYYFKFFGKAYIRYLKAYGNFNAKYPCPAGTALAGCPVNQFPSGTAGSGLAPSDLVNTVIDNESFFFDYDVAPGTGGAQTYDKFEYIDRTTIGQGVGGPVSNFAQSNFIPWDFEYGSDLVGGNQRYDNWYRRMDREEIGMYSAMLEDKTKTPGAENNVNITNLFGSPLLNGNPAAGVPGAWASYACAIGTAGDPATNGCGANPPLDPNQPGLTPCSPAGTCTGTNVCVAATSFENGVVQACAAPCQPALFTSGTMTGCPNPDEVCIANGATEGCMKAMMDKNVGTPLAQPLLSHYPGAWSRTPFSMGHSGITLAPSDKHPEIGVAHVKLPNYKDGPYTASPTPVAAGADGGLACPSGWTLQADGLCGAPLNSGTGFTAPFFNPLTPWFEVQPGVGFNIPISGTRNQYVTTGQFDYTGILESYIVDYTYWVDPLITSCVGATPDSSTACSPGYTCDPASKNCVDADNSLRIMAIEGKDFLGQAFLCQDPSTGDVLHVGMYDTALSIVNWLNAHAGNQSPFSATTVSAQVACQILLQRTPANNYIDQITSLVNGVELNISGGQGLGRVTDIVLFDPSLIQAL